MAVVVDPAKIYQLFDVAARMPVDWFNGDGRCDVADAGQRVN